MFHVDEALILPLLFSTLALLWVSYCGAVLVRISCRIHEWSLLAPLGLAAGSAIFLVCANLVGKVGSVPIAFGAAFLVVSALGIYASIRLWPRNWHIPSRRLALSVSGWTLLALALTYVCLAIRNQSYFYDFPSHLAFATTFALDNLPVKNPYAPVSVSGYHYGAALLVAALTRGTGLPAVTGYQLLATMQGAALLLLVFSLGREAGKHALWGLACLVAALSMGSLVVWWPFSETPAALSSMLQGNSSLEVLLQFPSLREYIELVYPIVSFSSDLRWLLIYPHRLAGLFTVVALAVQLVGPGRRRWGRASMALSISFAAAASLFDETMLPLALIALAWPLIPFRHKPQRLFLWSSGILVAVLLAALQGGSVTDSLLNRAGSSSFFTIRPALDVAHSVVLGRILPDGWLWILPPVPLAACILVFTWKRWWLGVMLCGFSLAGYVGFHLVEYQGVSGTGQFSRVVNISFLMLALLVPLAIARLLRDAPWWRTAIIVTLLVPIGAPTLTQPIASTISDLRRPISLHHPNTPGLIYTPQITDPWVTRQLDEYRNAYRDIAQVLTHDSVVLTRFPVSFVIATGIPTAFGSIDGRSTFASHIYFPGPRFYDAFWRLDPRAWRAVGATAILFHKRTYDSLPLTARSLLDAEGWFVRQYENHQFLLFTPTEAFLQHGPAPPHSLYELNEQIPQTHTLHLSTELPFGIGQALVRLFKSYRVVGLGPDNRTHQWIAVNRPSSLTKSEAMWHVRSHTEVRLDGIIPEAALWRWRSPTESVGIYPNALIPSFSLRLLSAGQSMRLQANEQSLTVGDAVGSTSPVHFRSLSVVLAGHPGSIVQLCTPAGCERRDLAGGTWSISLPLTAVLSQFTISALQGGVLVSGTLGYGEALSAVRTTGVALQPRQIENTIEVDVSYFNHQGWSHGDGVAWDLVRVGADKTQEAIWWASQLLIHGERGDVRLTIEPSGKFTEYNFTTLPHPKTVDSLTDAAYYLYLVFTIDPFGIVDRVPVAQFEVDNGTIATFTPLAQIAQLSFGTEHIDTIVLQE